MQLTFMPNFCMAYVLFVNEFSFVACPQTSNVLFESSFIISQYLEYIVGVYVVTNFEAM